MATGMMRWTTAARHGPGSFKDRTRRVPSALCTCESACWPVPTCRVRAASDDDGARISGAWWPAVTDQRTVVTH
jgi:hypothetical protein